MQTSPRDCSTQVSCTTVPRFIHPARRWAAPLLVLALLLCASLVARAAAPVMVGSKRFTESYVLGELVRQVYVQAGVPAQHRQGLGNTAVMAQALASGDIDLYPEYTGTIVRELLERDAAPASLDELNTWLAPRGLKVAVPLGFNNSYALALREADAQRLDIASLSDLARRGQALRPGFSHEFLTRADGWPALRQAYALKLQAPGGLDHGLAYQALARGQVDLIDVYTTDAQIARLGLRVLRDDRGFFPHYDAVLLMRATLDERPLAAALTGRIDAHAMRNMNAAVELDGQSFEAVARAFLAHPGTGSAPAAPHRPGFTERLFAPDLPRLLREHLVLVFGSLALALLIGVPVGLAAFVWPGASGVLMGLVGVLQPVPALALLAFLIALVGRIGFVPALLALTVYALLPIVRNTHAGLQAVPAGQRQAALALGLRGHQVLWHVELPLALPTLLAGIQTAAVQNVGTATVATFIGAGGLGERIVAGLAVNDSAWMLAGAIPAALLALLTQWAFDLAERRWRRGR